MKTSEIIKQFEDEGVELTSNIQEAIYIFDDGRMLSGMFFDGSRTEDHRVIEMLFDDIDRYSKDFWETVVERTRVVQYVPETKMILLKGRQGVTKAQQDIIDKYKLEVDYF